MLSAIAAMSSSQSLIDRVAASMAVRDVPNPRYAAQESMWRICATEGWREAWSSAKESETVNQNPDTGIRTDVITDAMIDAAVTELAAGTP
jgi:hypothetical protein